MPQLEVPLEDEIRIAGRGFILITFAKLYFLLTSAIINIGLPRILGDPARFGDFRVVNSFLSVLTMVVITGTIQGISKITSEDNARATIVSKKGIIIHTFIGMPLGIAMFIFSDFISFKVLNDERLSIYLKISSFIVASYSFYAVFIGIFNGMKEFHKQSGCDIAFSTLKTSLIIIFVLLGFSVKGAFTGFSIASFIILIISIFIYKKSGYKSEEKKYNEVSLKRIALYMIPIMVYTLFLNLLLQTDVLVLKSVSFTPIFNHLNDAIGDFRIALIFHQFGIENISTEMKQGLAMEITSRLSGFYGATKNLAILPYQGVISLTFVVFPFISSSTYKGDIEKTKSQISQAMRFALIFSFFMIAILIAEPSGILSLLFGKEYIIGEYAMLFLLFATLFFALLYVANSIITGGGFPHLALAVSGITFFITFLIMILFLKNKISDPEIINSAAIAVTISIAGGFILSAIILLAKYKVIFPLPTLLRTILAIAIIYTSGIYISVHDNIFIILKCIFSGIMFFVIIILLREFKTEDFNSLKKIFKRSF